MRRPIIEAVKDTVGIDDTQTVRERIEEGGIIAEHREEINKRLQGSGGGCCNAAQAAKASRRDGGDYR